MKNLLTTYIKGDKYLWMLIALLALFSFLPVFSASSNIEFVMGKGTVVGTIMKHGMFLIVGLAIILLTQNINYKYYGGFAFLLMPVMAILLLITLLTPNQIGGAEARRWLSIPGVPLQIQTSTLASLVLLMYIARYLTKVRNEKVTLQNSFLILWIPILVTVGLILPANGSTAVMLFVLCLTLLFLGNYPIQYLIGIVIIGIASIAIFVAVILNTDVESEGSKISRVHTWKSRIENFAGSGEQQEESYQVKQAKSAIVQGGQFGKGPGKSAIKQTLPSSFADFIFAIIVEEYGSIGASFLIFIYLLILFRIVIIATKIHTFFGTLLVLAVGIPIILQAFINIGVAVNLFPVTGQPLPMISKGGTSMWITCAAFGIILSVSRQIKNKEEIEQEKKKNSEAVIEDIA